MKVKNDGSSGHKTKIAIEMDLFEHRLNIELNSAHENIRTRMKEACKSRDATMTSNQEVFLNCQTHLKVTII